MKKNKFSEESNNLLSLGTLHEEVIKEKERKKIGKLPIVLIIIGLILILVGFFYKDIDSFIKKYTNKKNTKEQVKKDPSISYYDCTSNKDDSTLGINKKVDKKYEFKDNKLRKVSEIITMSILDNSYEIGSNNIEIYYNKYDTALKDINVAGLIIKNDLKKSKFVNTTLIDFDILDVNQIPKNDYLKITNKKDQTLREIKEIEGRAGHICKLS